MGVPREQITGLVLAGGQGSRLGGVDKGLLAWRGAPLAAQALARLAPQVGMLAISANRHLADYARLARQQATGVAVWPDLLPGQPGPLAGLLTGLRHCHTPWLAAVPCDAPRFPVDLVARLGQAAQAAGARVACAGRSAAAPGQPPHLEPVFCLVRRELAPSLHNYLDAGGRQVQAWLLQEEAAVALFDEGQGEAAHAFFNINTPQERDGNDR